MALRFNVVNTEARNTITSLRFQATTSDNATSKNDTKKYSVKWTIYRSGEPSDRSTSSVDLCLARNGSVIRILSGLIPGRHYNIKAELYEGKVSTGTLKGTVNLVAQTNELTGTFKPTSRSSSVINMALTKMPALEYPIRVKLFYKNKKNTKWVLKSTTNIAANEKQDISYMFTGLKAENVYNFKAEIYKVDGRKTTYIKRFLRNASTPAYVPGLGDLCPDFKEVVEVPHTGKGYIVPKVSGELRSGFSIHLYESSDGETFTDQGAVTPDEVQTISGTIGTSKYYKLAVLDRNNNVCIENEPRQVDFTDLTWTDKVAGDPFVLDADDVINWANALLRLFEYDKATGGNVGPKLNYYNNLKGNIYFVGEGEVVFGGGYNALKCMSLLSQAYVTEQPVDPGIQRHYPVRASVINGIISAARTALETII